MFLQNTGSKIFQVNGYWKTQNGNSYLKIQQETAISYSNLTTGQYHQNRYKVKWLDHCRFLLIVEDNKSNVFPEPVGTTYEFECNLSEGNDVLMCNRKLLSMESNNVKLFFERSGKEEFENFRTDFKEKLKMALKSPVDWSIPGEVIN
ncbi:MAG: hypothetical protein A3G23_05260 [Bacteroidetes bacterium RIFCSPLOWO2_12_FULL_37_12]|nr:MAG: hypothetical protein A3G23_05260 [Bacteroidetes bacterium RIFCSPLOWO2_12_FULL_37_12]